MKGVGGNNVSVIGKRSCRVNMRANDDLSDSIEIHNAVYMSTSPFDILPSQLHVSNLNNNNYKVELFKHDNWCYV